MTERRRVAFELGPLGPDGQPSRLDDRGAPGQVPHVTIPLCLLLCRRARNILSADRALHASKAALPHIVV
jgi:hypothetical protein